MKQKAAALENERALERTEEKEPKEAETGMPQGEIRAETAEEVRSEAEEEGTSARVLVFRSLNGKKRRKEVFV